MMRMGLGGKGIISLLGLRDLVDLNILKYGN